MEWRQTGIDFSFISLFVALLRFIRLGKFHQFPFAIKARLEGVFDDITKKIFNELSWFLFAFHQQTFMNMAKELLKNTFDGMWI